MQWEGREESENVEDRRGMSGRTMAVGGGAGIVVLLLAVVLGVDPAQLTNIVNPGGDQGAAQQQDAPRQVDPAEERDARFTKVILHDTEVVWTELFQQVGKTYRQPKLILFSGRVDSACGLANSAVGPFYCPGDEHVYIDLGFYKDMERKLSASGEFAHAYVIAHEVGHHVQKLLGYSSRAHEERSRGGAGGNQASVRLELQADFLAGVWAHHAQKRYNFLERGDIESAMNAAYQIGDDRLQRQARGYVVPDSFTHGTSQQRQRWFMDGFRTGDLNRAQQLFTLRYEEL